MSSNSVSSTNRDMPVGFTMVFSLLGIVVKWSDFTVPNIMVEAMNMLVPFSLAGVDYGKVYNYFIINYKKKKNAFWSSKDNGIKCWFANIYKIRKMY